jgi:hypothetical protein
MWKIWRSGQVDGFQLFSGVLALVAAPIMLASDAPAGWSFFLLSVGIVLLLCHWAIANDVEFETLAWTDVMIGVAGLACIWLAVVYLTRDADGLPRLLPGYDGDNEHFLIVPGVLTLTVGAVFVFRTVAAARPRLGRS